MTTQASQKWYQQFWPWFLIALPSAVVIASIITIVIAVRHSDSLVVDNYYKEGLAINQENALDRGAVDRRLSARMTLRGGEIEVQMGPSSQLNTEYLQILWQHPTNQAQDFSTVLTRVSSRRYQGYSEFHISGRWYLQLQSANTAGQHSEWRLRSEVDFANGRQATFTVENTP